MGNQTALKAVLWAANAVAWGYVYVIDRNLKSEQKREARRQLGSLSIDLQGPEAIQVTYLKKSIPEFTIYQV